MSPHKAKRTVREFLEGRNLTNRLTAKTVGFMDLARKSKVFITIHDWEHSRLADEIRQEAHKHGICVEFKGGGV